MKENDLQVLGKTQSHVIRLDQQKTSLSENILIFAFLFNKLEQFYLSSSSSLEKWSSFFEFAAVLIALLFLRWPIV